MFQPLAWPPHSPELSPACGTCREMLRLISFDWSFCSFAVLSDITECFLLLVIQLRKKNLILVEPDVQCLLHCPQTRKYQLADTCSACVFQQQPGLFLQVSTKEACCWWHVVCVTAELSRTVKFSCCQRWSTWSLSTSCNCQGLGAAFVHHFPTAALLWAVSFMSSLQRGHRLHTD